MAAVFVRTTATLYANKPMSIPDFQSLMLPILQLVAAGGDLDNRELVATLAKQFNLTDIELAEMLPSGQQAIFTNRVAWAKAHLKKAELIESPVRGLVRITEAGRMVVKSRPERVSVAYLKRFQSYNWWQNRPTDTVQPVAAEVAVDTPDETMAAAHETLREQAKAELLERLKKCTPQFFERIVVRLLVAMGYGGSLVDAGQAIGRSGDGGIDGLIKEDRLGLDVVCVQAKRYQETTVGRPVVQAFAGSMEGFRARKGVLLTTSTFSKDAHDYVERIERKIVLIDGSMLAGLMLDYDIGVNTRRSYIVKQVDSDFFDEEAS